MLRIPGIDHISKDEVLDTIAKTIIVQNQEHTDEIVGIYKEKGIFGKFHTHETD